MIRTHTGLHFVIMHKSVTRKLSIVLKIRILLASDPE